MNDFSEWKSLSETVVIKGRLEDLLQAPKFRLFNPGTWTKKRREKILR